jgi:hypothetical protein
MNQKNPSLAIFAVSDLQQSTVYKCELKKIIMISCFEKK